MTVLVTGAAGFIGSHLVARLVDRGDNVVGIDNFNAYYSPEAKRRNIAPTMSNPRFRLYEVDICDRPAMEGVFASERIRKVAHLAAMPGVRASILNPELYQEVNVHGAHSLLDLASRYGVEGFVYASSSSVYGASARLPFSEDDRDLLPVSPYAATKRAGEELCLRHHQLYGLRCTCLRYFTVYGPRGRPDMAPYLFLEAVLQGHKLTMFGNGDSFRDYTYVDDIVDGTIAALDGCLPFEVINLGSSRPVALRRFIESIERLTGRTARVQQGPAQPGDIPATCADISRAKRLLGYSPQVEIEEGLYRFITWYQSAQPRLPQPTAARQMPWAVARRPHQLREPAAVL